MRIEMQLFLKFTAILSPPPLSLYGQWHLQMSIMRGRSLRAPSKRRVLVILDYSQQLGRHIRSFSFPLCMIASSVNFLWFLKMSSGLLQIVGSRRWHSRRRVARSHRRPLSTCFFFQMKYILLSSFYSSYLAFQTSSFECFLLLLRLLN